MSSVADAPPMGAVAPVEGLEESEEGAVPVEPYYWEEGGDPNVDWWGKLRHTLHFGGVKAIEGAEAVGEVVANTLGLNDSQYQYVIDALEADEMRAKREQRDEEDRRQMALEEEAARTRERQAHQGEGEGEGEVKQEEDAGAIELGDARLSLPGGSDGDAQPREGSKPMA